MDQLHYGEVAALRRRDVAISANVKADGSVVPELRLFVSRDISRTQGHVQERDPKRQAGIRPVLLPETTSAALAGWLDAGVDESEDALIWPAVTDPDKPIAYSVYGKTGNAAVEAAASSSSHRMVSGTTG